MAKRVIGLTGYAQTGKDTVGQILVSHRGYTRISFADNVREAVYRLNPIVDWNLDQTGPTLHGHSPYTLQELVTDIGWERAKTHYSEVRRLLQVMGTEVGRNMFGERAWIEMAGRQAAGHDKVVFTDVRFENEADFVRSLGGKVVRVYRRGTGPVNDHASDRIDFDADMGIGNDGTLDDLAEVILQLDSTGWSSL